MVKKVISGGQTGADRTGLEVAKELGIETGGWAPKGYKIDGGNDTSLADFGLKETFSIGYTSRTCLNVQDSDGTVLFGNMTSPGCKATISWCKSKHKPYLCNPSVYDLKQWLDWNKIETLNVAGNRLRINPQAANDARKVLSEVLKQ